MEIDLKLTDQEVVAISRGIIIMAKMPDSQPSDMSYYLSLFNKIQIQTKKLLEKGE